jgi:ATP-binding protein involved in chromosome partitioning
MKIALPVTEGKLCLHFGHCEEFIIFDVDDNDKKNVTSSQSFTPPPHEPGLLPRWLSDKNVQLVIAGGMGARAVTLFKERGVDVITGAPAGDPEMIIDTYLKGNLITGINACDH